MLMLVILALFYYKFDYITLLDDYLEMYRKLSSGPLQSLLNGSGVNNIPGLKIHTNNSVLATANDCATKPIRLATLNESEPSQLDCIQTCLSSTAQIFRISPNDWVAHNTTVLEPGYYCSIGPRPECNPNTTNTILTINSVHCHSKFPKMFGGDQGNRIVACNDATINDPKNILWDYKYNQPVSPWQTTMISTSGTDAQDERLESGEYRFRCIYDGVDSMSNRYIPHPADRFHPVINYCASLIRNAHPNVQTKFLNNGSGEYICDCGKKSETGVELIAPDNPQSQCAPVTESITDDVKARKIVTVPYKCFNINSSIDDVLRLPPCADFANGNINYQTLRYEFTQDPNALIEHPLYKDFTNDGAMVPLDPVQISDASLKMIQNRKI